MSNKKMVLAVLRDGEILNVRENVTQGTLTRLFNDIIAHESMASVGVDPETCEELYTVRVMFNHERFKVEHTGNFSTWEMANLVLTNWSVMLNLTNQRTGEVNTYMYKLINMFELR